MQTNPEMNSLTITGRTFDIFIDHGAEAILDLQSQCHTRHNINHTELEKRL